MVVNAKYSCVHRYFWNLKFLIFLCICVAIITCAIYFPLNIKLEETPSETVQQVTEHEREQAQNETVSESVRDTKKWENNEEVQIFREYLRIPSVHPNIDYEPCVEFLRRQAKSLDLPVSVSYPVDAKNPVVVLTWEGSKPNLPSIMLNSHMDVVGAYEEYWIHPPFAAAMDGNGNIFARGAQDTKAIGTQYLAAIRALKRDGVKQLNRTVHVVFSPDEEPGGLRGMAGFVHSNEFKQMNIGIMLDEGGVEHPKPNELSAYTSERTVWKIELIFHGNSGHGSLLHKNTAAEKLSYVIGKFMEMRRIESWKLNVLNYSYGKVTTINLTILKGGIENNIVPAEISATFDLRFSADANLKEFESQVEEWCNEAGGNITINYPQKEPQASVTATDDSNPFWRPFASAFTELNLTLISSLVMPGASDARYIRRLNIPAIGFNPFVNTTGIAHKHNEFLNADIYLFGIEVYKRIIRNMGSI